MTTQIVELMLLVQQNHHHPPQAPTLRRYNGCFRLREGPGGGCLRYGWDMATLRKKVGGMVKVYIEVEIIIDKSKLFVIICTCTLYFGWAALNALILYFQFVPDFNRFTPPRAPSSPPLYFCDRRADTRRSEPRPLQSRPDRHLPWSGTPSPLRYFYSWLKTQCTTHS